MFSLKSAIAGLSAVAILSFATASSAATVLNGVTLHRVEILGSNYDVTFRDGVFDTLFPDPEITFPSLGDATTAVNAIRSTAAYQSFQPMDPFFAGFLVPYRFRDELVVWSVVGGGTGIQGAGGWYRFHNYGDQFTWAEFTLTAVPEPATWAMMIVGFGAVGSMVRATARGRTASARYVSALRITGAGSKRVSTVPIAVKPIAS